MKLSSLFEAIQADASYPPAKTEGSEPSDPHITSIHYRSDEVQPGGLFIAVKGFRADGHAYVQAAVDKGAAAIVAERRIPVPVPLMVVSNSRECMASIADRFYGSPSKNLIIIGITGTNGKTTTAFLVESLLAQAGLSTGVIGTINYRYGGNTYENPMTTPEAPDLQHILRKMHSSGISHVVMEVSSHAIDLHRIDHCLFDIGVFTNLSQDHLDYHHNMEAYWNCKKRLFTQLLLRKPDGKETTAVINTDDPKGSELCSLLESTPHAPRILACGMSGGKQIKLLRADITMRGIEMEIETPAGTASLRSPLIGRYNLENILSAVGVGVALNLPLEAMQTAISSFTTVPGRLESVDNDRGRHVVVDYAHTPDALENVLTTLKAIKTGKLICIFGCGGDRDRSKRPRMGEIAARLADLTVVTSDNPRSENPAAIIDEIVSGILPFDIRRLDIEAIPAGLNGNGYLVEKDRKRAIRIGMQISKPGDTILIAGKGHETYQLVGDRKLPFDDREEAKQAIEDVNG